MKKIFSMLITAVLCVSGFMIPVKAEGTTPVSFSVTDANGNIINSNVENSVYYMFLTNAVKINNVVLKCNGDTIKTCTDSNGAAFGTIDTVDATTVTGAFTVGQTITVTGTKGAYSVCVMQSSLPSLFIDLSATESLDKIHADKEHRATGSTVKLTDPANINNNISATDVEMKGRGNSSWGDYEKKGYQIKFSSKTNVLGLGKAKKWVLLANSSDASMMTNKLAYDLAKNIDLPFPVEGEYTDLWIDGDYRGTYLISDKVEIGSTRVNVGDTDVVAEMDSLYYQEEAYFVDILGNHFALKDPDSTDTGALDNFKRFESMINEMEENIANTDYSKLTEKLDVDSIAKMYLVNEFLSNNEYTITSNFWYSNGKIFAGPVWDFDTSTYKEGTSSSYFMKNCPILAQLLQRQDFRERTKQIYNQYRSSFQKIPAEIDTLEQSLQSSANMNYVRWNRLGQPDPRSGVFLPTYDGNVQKLKTWITERNNLFRPYESSRSLYVDVNSSRNQMTITYVDTDKGDETINTAVWNNNNDQDDLKWYVSDYAGNHTWVTTVNLSDHEYAGTFTINLYDGSGCVIGGVYGVRDFSSSSTDTYMYRMYNPNSGEHFYTAAVDERDHLKEIGWIYEGIGWRAPKNSSSPVYRLYNGNGGEHHYTLSSSEKDYLVSVGWSYEGIGWYSDDAKTTPLYRQYNPNAFSCNHNYTTSKSESDWLVSLGWNYEGISWYGL